MMDAKIEREILAAHADQLNAGLRGSAAYPSMTSEQRSILAPLLQVAEWLAEALVFVEPSPAFVQKLGQELALAATKSQLSLFERYRKAILVLVATLGSALSLLGLVLFYLVRQRDTAQSTPAT
jgi:hypothetical protein